MIAAVVTIALVLLVAWPTVFMVAAHILYSPGASRRRVRPEFE